MGTVKILVESTLEIFGTKVEDLRHGSDAKVMVRCMDCGEVMTREFKLVGLLHQCPTPEKEHLDGVREFLINGEFEEDDTVLLNQWQRQDGRCFYLKMPLNLSRGPFYPVLEYLGRGRYIWVSRMAAMARAESGHDIFDSDLLRALSESEFGMPRVEVELRNPDASVPVRSRSSDVGYDIKSLVDAVIKPGQVVSIDTGMAVVAPFGFYFTVEGRSSMYQSGVVPFRGIIDSGYVGNMIVSLMNVGSEPYSIKKGDRIAQLCLHKIVQADYQRVEKVSNEYNIRGTAGFGSSGK